MITENYKIVPVMNSADISTSADTDSIDMSGYHRATYLFTFGAVTTDITFTPKSGITEGTKTTAVPSRYAVGGAAIGTAVAGSTASCDVLAAWTATATTAVTTANSNTFYVIEIEAASMTPGHDWLTITLTTATGGICHCVVILEPRYSGNRSATALK
jgi:hypothetical protein